MTRNLDSPSTERSTSRAYLIEFGGGMLAYLTFLSSTLIWGHLDGDSPWRFLWALLAVLPALWIVVAIIRHIRRIDEYQRYLLLQGLGAGFGIAMVASVTLGFLSIAGLTVPLMGWVIFGLGMLGWIVATSVLKKR